MFRRLTLILLLMANVAGPVRAALGPPAAATLTVKPGDTLSGVAKRTGLSVARLKTLNNLKSDVIRVGQVLRLGGAPAKAPASAGAGMQGWYTVKRGDTLGAIAGRAGVTVGALQLANRLTGTVIRPGQKLRVPARGTRGAAPLPPGTEVRTVYRYVRVALKDTPEALAARHRLSVDALRRLNALGSRAHIVPGKKLLVPSRVPVPVPPAPRREAVTYRKARALNIPVDIVQVDLRHRDVLVAPVLPGRGFQYGAAATVSELARRSGAMAVINGSYFHPQSYAPAGDIVMQGRLLTWGRIPMALAITPDNRATIRATTTPVLARPLDATWAGMETVIATGPRILAGGQVNTRYSTAFRDPALFGRAARSAIGLSSNRDLILVSTRSRLTTTEMGKVMRRLGVKDALLLDGGSSTGLAWKGRAVQDSVRRVSYGIGVFASYTGRRYQR